MKNIILFFFITSVFFIAPFARAMDPSDKSITNRFNFVGSIRGAKSFVMIYDKEAKRNLYIEVGQSLPGFESLRLTKILPKAAVFSANGSSISLELNANSSSSAQRPSALESPPEKKGFSWKEKTLESDPARVPDLTDEEQAELYRDYREKNSELLNKRFDLSDDRLDQRQSPSETWNERQLRDDPAFFKHQAERMDNFFRELESQHEENDAP